MIKSDQTNSGDQTDDKDSGRRKGQWKSDGKDSKRRRDTNDSNEVDDDIDQTKCNDQRDEKGRWQEAAAGLSLCLCGALRIRGSSEASRFETCSNGVYFKQDV